MFIIVKRKNGIGGQQQLKKKKYMERTGKSSEKQDRKRLDNFKDSG